MNIETIIETIINQGLNEYQDKGYGESNEKDIKKAKKKAIRDWQDLMRDEMINNCLRNTKGKVSLPSSEILELKINLSVNYLLFNDDDEDDGERFYVDDEAYEFFKHDEQRFYIIRSKPVSLSLQLEIEANGESSDYFQININPSRTAKEILSKKIERINRFLDRKKCGRCGTTSPTRKVSKDEVGCEKCKFEEMKPIECSICLDNECIKKIGIIKCGHIFHRECIRTWCEDKKSCPLCRKYTLSFSIESIPRQVQLNE
jgi:hypothetical protein